MEKKGLESDNELSKESTEKAYVETLVIRFHPNEIFDIPLSETCVGEYIPPFDFVFDTFDQSCLQLHQRLL